MRFASCSGDISPLSPFSEPSLSVVLFKLYFQLALCIERAGGCNFVVQVEFVSDCPGERRSVETFSAWVAWVN